MINFKDYLYSEMAMGHVKAQTTDDRGKFDVETLKMFNDLKRSLEGGTASKYSFEAKGVTINEPEKEGGHMSVTGKAVGPSGKEVSFKVAIPDGDWKSAKGFDVYVDGKKIEGLKYSGIEQPASYLQSALKQAIFGTKGSGAGAKKLGAASILTALREIKSDAKAMEMLGRYRTFDKLKALIDSVSDETKASDVGGSAPAEAATE